MSRYQKGKTSLDFTEARDSEWQWHQLGHMQVCTLPQTDNHASTQPLSFLQARCLSCCQTNSVKALKAKEPACLLAIGALTAFQSPWNRGVSPLGGLSWLATPALHPSFSTSTQLVGILALVYMEFFMNVLDGDAGVVTGVINGRNTVCVQRWNNCWDVYAKSSCRRLVSLRVLREFTFYKVVR